MYDVLIEKFRFKFQLLIQNYEVKICDDKDTKYASQLIVAEHVV